MDSKLLLVKCITLLYREAELKQFGGSIDICQEVIETIKLPENSIEVQTGRDAIVGLRATVQWLFDEARKERCEKTQLLQRVRINAKEDTYLYNAVLDGLNTLENEDAVKEIIVGYRTSIKEHLATMRARSILVKAFSQTNFGNMPPQEHQELIRAIRSDLEPFEHASGGKGKHASVVDEVSFDNPEEIVELLKRSQDELSSGGVLRTGWHAFNRMLGESNGFRRGETVVVGALQHNFKTGFTMNLFKHLALYNIPYMRDETKKPLLLHISLENELPMNIMWLYTNIKENETGEAVDISMVDIDEATEYIRLKMGVNGYSIKMLRIEPGACSYYDITDMILQLETEGYEIHGLVIDYLSMLNKKGLDTTGAMGTEKRDLFNKMRNFCAPRGITFITPHQLSTQAKELVRQGVENFVQEIANKGYYEGSKQIDQEVDIEIYIHIEKVPGRGSLLTIQRGKHRKITITPDKDLYTVLPFNDVGGILDDINGEDSSMKSVGAVGGGGTDWFDMS